MTNSFHILRDIFADLCPEILQIFFKSTYLSKCLDLLILSGGSCLAEFNLNVALCYHLERTTVISNKHKLFRA